MNANMRLDGASLRQRMTYHFDSVPRPRGLDLSYLRASGLAQMRLQLAVLSGNRRGALREIDRLVEIDRELEALSADDRSPAELPGAALIAQLDQQRQAIATEKLALMAAIEFPRIAPAERAAEEPAPEEEHFEVVEDTEFGRRLLIGLGWLLAIIAVGTTLAFAVPALVAL
jgi:hypothetical protein